jgi:hypothetical protein
VSNLKNYRGGTSSQWGRHPMHSSGAELTSSRRLLAFERTAALASMAGDTDWQTRRRDGAWLLCSGPGSGAFNVANPAHHLSPYHPTHTSSLPRGVPVS